MKTISRKITAFLARQLESETGVNAALSEIRKLDSQGPQNIRHFTVRNMAADLLEKSNQALYPSVLVYCDKLSNTLVEKFRAFSGLARLSVEIRNSSDRVEGLDGTLIYADVVCSVLDTMRGEWFPGVFFNGGYEVVFSAVREGGKHFLQSAKISFEVSVSE